jgi:hypothetical protein
VKKVMETAMAHQVETGDFRDIRSRMPDVIFWKRVYRLERNNGYTGGSFKVKLRERNSVASKLHVPDEEAQRCLRLINSTDASVEFF